MTVFQAMAMAATLTALCAVISVKLFKLQGSLGMAVGIAFAAGSVSPQAEAWAVIMWKSLDFKEAVFHGMLCVLLFAGAMHVNLSQIAQATSMGSLLKKSGLLSEDGQVKSDH